MSTKSPDLFLRSVHFKGFKSIGDLRVTNFKKGLNILIGKNGSGKSNFLECLSQTMEVSHSRVSNSSYKFGSIEFISSNKDIIRWESEREVHRQLNLFNRKKNSLLFDLTKDSINLNEKLFVNGKKVFDNNTHENNFEYKSKNISVSSIVSIPSVLARMGYYYFYPLSINFNLPDNLDCISTSGTISINIGKGVSDWNHVNTLRFLLFMFIDVELSIKDEDLKNINKSNLLKKLKIDKEIKENLKKYTPIQDIKFNENINIYKTDKVINIENLKIDFKLNNDWIPWSQLSDGTKRLFYIISEITNQKMGLILVEEPELGVHPHQFNLIMDFLKEQSEDKQIIISTHSPQALNHLTEDELTHILVTSYDSKKGTQIKHLTSAQINKAKKYMKEVGFFSDYWMLSDLE